MPDFHAYSMEVLACAKVVVCMEIGTTEQHQIEYVVIEFKKR